MTKRQISEKYASLLKDVQNNDFYKIDLTKRVNVYRCPNGHMTKTKDVDAGVTPFRHRCPQCNSMAKSSMYSDIAPKVEVTEEWYRPSLKEILKLAKVNPPLVDHVLRGGLTNRPVLSYGKLRRIQAANSKIARINEIIVFLETLNSEIDDLLGGAWGENLDFEIDDWTGEYGENGYLMDLVEVLELKEAELLKENGI